MEHLISVIVPVYNVEPYLRQCIDSILAQTYTNFELILVDDGSPDNCGAICDEYAAKDSRIVVIHQKNQGVAVARNTALDIMRGEYVAFIDSDDYVAPAYLVRLYEALMESQADISTCLWKTDTNGIQNIPDTLIQKCKKNVLSGPEAVYQMYNEEISIGVHPWAKLISKKLMMHRRFPSDKICEDRAVLPFVLYDSPKVAVVTEMLYFYRLREGSLEHLPFSIKRFDDVQHMNNFIEYAKHHKDKKMVSVARKRRAFHLALYTLKAKVAHIDNIPKGCRMGTVRALYIMRKNYSYNWYAWYLNQIYPFWTRVDAYIRKLESLVSRKPL